VSLAQTVGAGPLEFDELGRRAGADRSRRPVTLTVARPWGWFWWPGDLPLAGEEREWVDRAGAQVISSPEVDWVLVFHAVLVAISSLPTDPEELLALTSFEVSLPFGLTAAERTLAQSWVGAAEPVVCRPEQQLVIDGGRRLGLTREDRVGCDLPLFDEHLLPLQHARAGQLPRAAMTQRLADEARWWASQPPRLQETALVHLGVLAQVYLELTQGVRGPVSMD
jgi:hypothetical protein